MLGNPMPPCPDEPTPRQLRRADERRPWVEHGLYLGESDPEVEHMAALRAAVEIARMMRQQEQATQVTSLWPSDQLPSNMRPILLLIEDESTGQQHMVRALYARLFRFDSPEE